MKYLAIMTAAALVLGFTDLTIAQTDTASTANASPQAHSSPTESTHTSQIQQTATPVVKANSTVKKIGFRLKDWKTIHAHSQDDAEVTIATLKKIGCEVETDNHGNHIDVRYRCPDWKSMKLATDQLVNQWTTWCAAKGMETVVMNPPQSTQKPTVAFRLPAERTVHLHDAVQAKQILNTLKLIGCEVSSNQHGDHTDATFNCPNWITIEVPSETKAHGWQKWLDESGFETQHSH